MDLQLTTRLTGQNPIEGDLEIQANDATYLDGQQAKAQHLRVRLRTFLAEWFLNTDEGLPYFQDILVKNPDIRRIEEVYRRAVLTTPGFVALDRFRIELDRANRTLSITDFEARTDEGLVIRSEDFLPFVVEF
jgi:hypothetical protein